MHEAVGAALQTGVVTDEIIGVHEFAALEPPAGPVEIARAAFRDSLNLRAGSPPEFGRLAVGGNLQLGYGIDVDPVGELLIDADIGHGLAINRVVVLEVALAIDVGIAGETPRRSGDGFKQRRVVTAIQRQIFHLPGVQQAGALGGERFQLDGTCVHGNRLGRGTHLKRNWG